jgi:hypothetical protein
MIWFESQAGWAIPAPAGSSGNSSFALPFEHPLWNSLTAMYVPEIEKRHETSLVQEFRAFLIIAAIDLNLIDYLYASAGTKVT